MCGFILKCKLHLNAAVVELVVVTLVTEFTDITAEIKHSSRELQLRRLSSRLITLHSCPTMQEEIHQSGDTNVQRMCNDNRAEFSAAM